MRDIIIIVINTAFYVKKIFSYNNLCPQNVCFYFIHAFELRLGKYTVFLLMESFLLQTLSIGNNVLVSQHLTDIHCIIQHV